MTTLWDIAVSRAESTPEQVLFADRHGRTLTAATLCEAAERTAAGLGLNSESTVSWQLPNCLEAVVLMMAGARVGAIQNPIIPILREREVALILDQVAPHFLVVPDTWGGFSFTTMAQELSQGRSVSPVTLDLDGTPSEALRLPSGDPASLPDPPVRNDRAKWVYFTSGTTGFPKGARHSDASLIASSRSMTERLAFVAGQVYPIAWPFTHIGGVINAAAVLRGGGQLVLYDRFDPATFGDEVAACEPTILGTGIYFFRSYLDAEQRHPGPRYPKLHAH